jgi:hypothetical protein
MTPTIELFAPGTKLKNNSSTLRLSKNTFAALLNSLTTKNTTFDTISSLYYNGPSTIAKHG